MIKLYREQVSPKADQIEAEFQDSLLGYDLEILTPIEGKERFGDRHSLPLITDHDRTVSGEALLPYVTELQTLMRNWLLLSGGTCYVDDEGIGC